MATAALFVRCGKKIDAAAEKSIRASLLGKRFTMQLDFSDIDAKQGLTNASAVEKKIEQVLKKAAPELLMAKGFDFKSSLKTAGDIKLMVKTETEAVYACLLQLKPPAAPKEVAGKYKFDKLVSCDFKDILSSQYLAATVDYTINHPEGARLVRYVETALAGTEKEIEKQMDAAVSTTVSKLKKGLASQGSESMSWKDAKKLVDGLNHEIQRIINTIADAANAAVKKGVPAKYDVSAVTCSVVAMFGKFEILGGVYFPGGDKPLVSEKSLSTMSSDVAKLDAMAKKLDASGKTLATSADAFCAAQRKLYAAALLRRKESAAPGETDTPAKDQIKEIALQIEANMRGLHSALCKVAEKAYQELEHEFKRAGGLTNAVEKIEKLHAKDKPKNPEAKADHIKAGRELERFRKQADQFEAILRERLELCEGLQGTLKSPYCFTPDGAKRIEDAAGTIEKKGLEAVAGKLAVMCHKAVETMN